MKHSVSTLIRRLVLFALFSSVLYSQTAAGEVKFRSFTIIADEDLRKACLPEMLKLKLMTFLAEEPGSSVTFDSVRIENDSHLPGAAKTDGPQTDILIYLQSHSSSDEKIVTIQCVDWRHAARLTDMAVGGKIDDVNHLADEIVGIIRQTRERYKNGIDRIVAIGRIHTDEANARVLINSAIRCELSKQPGIAVLEDDYIVRVCEELRRARLKPDLQRLVALIEARCVCKQIELKSSFDCPILTMTVDVHSCHDSEPQQLEYADREFKDIETDMLAKLTAIIAAQDPAAPVPLQRFANVWTESSREASLQGDWPFAIMLREQAILFDPPTEDDRPGPHVEMCWLYDRFVQKPNGEFCTNIASQRIDALVGFGHHARQAIARRDVDIGRGQSMVGALHEFSARISHHRGDRTVPTQMIQYYNRWMWSIIPDLLRLEEKPRRGIFMPKEKDSKQDYWPRGCGVHALGKFDAVKLIVKLIHDDARFSYYSRAMDAYKDQYRQRAIDVMEQLIRLSRTLKECDLPPMIEPQYMPTLERMLDNGKLRSWFSHEQMNEWITKLRKINEDSDCPVATVLLDNWTGNARVETTEANLKAARAWEDTIHPETKKHHNNPVGETIRKYIATLTERLPPPPSDPTDDPFGIGAADNPFGPPVRTPVAGDDPFGPPVRAPVAGEDPFGPPVRAPVAGDNPFGPPVRAPVAGDDPFGSPVRAPVAGDDPFGSPVRAPVAGDDPFARPAVKPACPAPDVTTPLPPKPKFDDPKIIVVDNKGLEMLVHFATGAKVPYSTIPFFESRITYQTVAEFPAALRVDSITPLGERWDVARVKQSKYLLREDGKLDPLAPDKSSPTIEIAIHKPSQRFWVATERSGIYLTDVDGNVLGRFDEHLDIPPLIAPIKAENHYGEPPFSQFVRFVPISADSCLAVATSGPRRKVWIAVLSLDADGKPHVKFLLKTKHIYATDRTADNLEVSFEPSVGDDPYADRRKPSEGPKIAIGRKMSIIPDTHPDNSLLIIDLKTHEMEVVRYDRSQPFSVENGVFGLKCTTVKNTGPENVTFRVGGKKFGHYEIQRKESDGEFQTITKLSPDYRTGKRTWKAYFIHNKSHAWLLWGIDAYKVDLASGKLLKKFIYQQTYPQFVTTNRYGTVMLKPTKLLRVITDAKEQTADHLEDTLSNQYKIPADRIPELGELIHRCDRSGIGICKTEKIPGNHMYHWAIQIGRDSTLDPKLLADITKFPNLLQAYVTREKISPELIASLADLPELEFLHIVGTKIAPEALRPLARMKSLSNIKLFVRNLNRETIESFPDLPQYNGYVTIYGSDLKKEDIERLREKVPAAKTVYWWRN